MWDKAEVQWNRSAWELKKFEGLQTRSDIQCFASWVLMHAPKTDFEIYYLEKVKQLMHIIHCLRLTPEHPHGKLQVCGIIGCIWQELTKSTIVFCFGVFVFSISFVLFCFSFSSGGLQIDDVLWPAVRKHRSMAWQKFQAILKGITLLNKFIE